MGNFEGKVALVTGGANGIGKGIAEKFAKEGANTVIVDYDAKKGGETAGEITNQYCKSIFIQTDVSDPEALVKVREETFKAFGRIDILVLNAGIAKADKVSDVTMEAWHRTININLGGLFNTVKAFYDDFLTNKGSIVYISSGSALSGTGGSVAYPASKAGGEGLMRGLAKELGPLGVNVNTIAPRVIESGLLRVNYPTEESLNKLLGTIPVRRFGTVEDVANLTIFLADKANSYIQGQTILLDGGRTIA